MITMLIKVVAALIEKDNKVLIAKCSTGDPNVYGKWEFPGGKVELNEDDVYIIKNEKENNIIIYFLFLCSKYYDIIFLEGI